MGHLLTAACIHHRATGKRNFLVITRKLADYLYTVFELRPKELVHFGFNPSNSVRIDRNAKWQVRHEANLLHGVTVLETQARVVSQPQDATALYRRVPAANAGSFLRRLIAYYAWGNHGVSEMTAWLPALRERKNHHETHPDPHPPAAAAAGSAECRGRTAAEA